MFEEFKIGDSEEFWDYIVDCFYQFVEIYYGDVIKLFDYFFLGFIFFYLVIQNYIDEGIFQWWMKGFDIVGVEGKNVVFLFEVVLVKCVCLYL